MLTTTVVVAPPSQRPVLDVLLDLSAAGLVAPFGWVEGTPDGTVAPGVPVLWVDQGTTDVRDLPDVVSVAGAERARLVLLVPAGPEQGDALSAAAEQSYRQQFRPRAGVPCTYVRVLLLWAPLGQADFFRGSPGWHNVALSPEDSPAPDVHPVPWWTTPERVPAAAAAGIAGIAGLWATEATSPFDAEPGGSESIRVVRTFMRQTDAQAVTDTLRREVTRTDRGVPQPSATGVDAPSPYLPHPLEATEEMARRWWEKNKRRLRGDRVSIPPITDTPVRLGMALRMFFSFLLSALKRAPRAWVRTMVYRTKAVLAASVHESVFGSGSAYTVVLRGVRADGTPADWAEVGDSAQVLVQAVPRADGDPQPAPANLSALWQDLVEGAFTLVDAQERDADLPPPRVGSDVGVVPDVADVAPRASAAAGTFAVPGSVLGSTTGQVRAADFLGAEALDTALKDAETRHGYGDRDEAERVRHDFARWRLDQQRRYVPHVGALVGKAVQYTRSEAAWYAEQLAELADPQADGELLQHQARLAKILRILFWLCVAVLAGTGVLAALEVLAAGTAWRVVGIAVGVWFVSSLGVYLRGQQLLFQVIHRRDELARRSDSIRANLRVSLQDLSTLCQAYVDLQQWAVILGEFLHRPLGGEDEQATAVPSPAGLPRSVQVVQVEADEDDLAMTAAGLRQRLFRPGWLSQAWEDTLTDMPRALDAEQRVQLMHRPAGIYRASGPGALPTWAAAVARQGTTGRAGGRWWADAVDLLSTGAVPRPQLRVSGTGAPADRFAESLADEGARGARVVTEMLSVDAQAQGRGAIMDAQQQTSRSGLSIAVELVQLTAAMAPGEVVTGTTELRRTTPEEVRRPMVNGGEVF